MNIKAKPFKIENDNPFQNDVLNRKESAEILTQFIKNLNSEPYVIAIDSLWGTGKTTFLKMWQVYLENNKIYSVYFNAWESDINDDVLISLIGEIQLHLTNSSLDKKNKIKATKHLEEAKKVGYNIVKKGLPIAIKLATQGLLDFSKTTEDSLASMTEEFTKEQFLEYENSKKSLQKFKDSLENFSKEISDSGPLVFIVDELDRCRPDYAVKVLEKIKHLFSINNIVFVLGVDKKQLGFSIKKLYGDDTNTNGYLSRFIDFDYNLPKPDRKSFIEFTIGRHNLEDFFSSRLEFPNLVNDKENIINMLNELFILFNFSLRDIEHVISQLTIVIKVTKKNEYLHPVFLCYLLTIRKKDLSLYKKVIERKFAIDEIMKIAGVDKITNLHYEQVLRAYLESSIAYPKNEDATSIYVDILNAPGVSDSLKEDAERMLNIIKDINFQHHGDIIEFLVKKIEISSSFE